MENINLFLSIYCLDMCVLSKSHFSVFYSRLCVTCSACMHAACIHEYDQINAYTSVHTTMYHFGNLYTHTKPFLENTCIGKMSFTHLLKFIYLHNFRYTIMTQSFWTVRSGQTVQTQIRLLLKEQSDQGLHCLLFHLHHFDKIPFSFGRFV